MNIDYSNYKRDDWNKLTGKDWRRLLIEKPQFSEFCDWNKLSGYNWRYLLRHQPQFYKYYKI